jgi:hypothetical protein
MEINNTIDIQSIMDQFKKIQHSNDLLKIFNNNVIKLYPTSKLKSQVIAYSILVVVVMAVCVTHNTGTKNKNHIIDRFVKDLHQKYDGDVPHEKLREIIDKCLVQIFSILKKKNTYCKKTICIQSYNELNKQNMLEITI